jgi:hypothetical protein
VSQICTICLKEKADTAFKLAKGRTKRDCACKECRQEHHRGYLGKWRADNRSRNLELQRQCYHRNRAKRLLEMKTRYQTNRESEIARYVTYLKSHPDIYKAKVRRWTAARKANPILTLRHRIAVQIRFALGGHKNRANTEQLLGYTIQELRMHLEKLFSNGMSWNNYGKIWHIDHIIPVSVFNITSPEDPDVRRCWALQNLRPLSCHDNCSKQAKLEKPFQPMLNLNAVKQLQ